MTVVCLGCFLFVHLHVTSCSEHLLLSHLPCLSIHSHSTTPLPQPIPLSPSSSISTFIQVHFSSARSRLACDRCTGLCYITSINVLPLSLLPTTRHQHFNLIQQPYSPLTSTRYLRLTRNSRLLHDDGIWRPLPYLIIRGTNSERTGDYINDISSSSSE
jgi:hypothetical protein